MSKTESEKLENLVKDYMETDSAKPPELEVLKALCKAVTIRERLSIIQLPRKHFIDAHSRKDGYSNEDINCLHLAAKQGDTDMISVMLDDLPEDVKVELLTLTAKIDGQNNDVVAVTSGQGNVEWLIREVNLFLRENNKSIILISALSHASFDSKLPAVCAIIEQLNSDTRVDTLLSTPSTLASDKIATHCAAFCGDAAIMKAILAGLSRDDATELLLARNKITGRTALHYAIQDNNPSMVKVILEGRSSEDLFDLLVVKDNGGNTAVHCAAINASRVLIKALSIEKLSSGQQMEVFKVVDNENRTISDLAKQNGNIRALRYFQELHNQASDHLKTLHDGLTEQIHKLTIQRDLIALKLQAQRPLKLPDADQDKLGAGVLTNEYKRIADVKMPEKNTFKSVDNQWNIIGPESSSGGFGDKFVSLDTKSNIQNNLGGDVVSLVEGDTVSKDNKIHVSQDTESDGAFGGEEDSVVVPLAIDPLRGPESFPDQHHDEGEPAQLIAMRAMSQMSLTTKSRVYSAKDDAPSGI